MAKSNEGTRAGSKNKPLTERIAGRLQLMDAGGKGERSFSDKLLSDPQLEKSAPAKAFAAAIAEVHKAGVAFLKSVPADFKWTEVRSAAGPAVSVGDTVTVKEEWAFSYPALKKNEKLTVKEIKQVGPDKGVKRYYLVMDDKRTVGPMSHFEVVAK